MILQQRQLQNSLGVTPAKVGVQEYVKKLDSRFRGNDNLGLMHLAQRIVIAGLLLLGMPVAPYADAAELLSQFHPYISVKEEYSDNLNLTSDEQERGFLHHGSARDQVFQHGQEGGCGSRLLPRGGLLWK